MNHATEFVPVECLCIPKALFFDKRYEDLSVDARQDCFLYPLHYFFPCVSPFYATVTVIYSLLMVFTT